jgi:predicted ATPase
MLSLTETFGSERTTFDATLLSDGTLRVLAVAAMVHSATKGSLIVIEEIDNGVHPSRAHMLLQRISEVATEKGVRVLISSHNPALLDALPDESIPNVVFCFRKQDGSSGLVRLDDLDSYPELVAQGGLGELLTRGTIDRYVKRAAGSGAKKSRAIEWLNKIA